ncbi:sulfurtransferase TusA family protein [Amphibiibacter pelophylacis]|uniref:Sulfurtransferase TusA family protein n=1 Tax=Amphibiibacter pelophylacis TaxID=1799477 RepID=A0ACC6P3W2_9BURK
MSLPDFDQDLDTTGLNCPMPILKAKKALAAMQPAQVLRITTTDPSAELDFQAFARQTGNALLAQEAGEGRVMRHFLRRKG